MQREPYPTYIDSTPVCVSGQEICQRYDYDPGSDDTDNHRGHSVAGTLQAVHQHKHETHKSPTKHGNVSDVPPSKLGGFTAKGASPPNLRTGPLSSPQQAEGYPAVV
jgi:hypothetical protein